MPGRPGKPGPPGVSRSLPIASNLIQAPQLVKIRLKNHFRFIFMIET